MSQYGGGGYYLGPSTPPVWQQPFGHPSAPAQNTLYAQQPSAHPPSSSVSYAQPASSPWEQHNPSAQAYTPGYGGYPPYAYSPHGTSDIPSSFPPGTDPAIVRAFEAADRDRNGRINEQELQQILASTQPFGLRTVKLMIQLFGHENSREIGPKEFAVLWKVLKDWKGVFERFDKDRNGSMDTGEMKEAFLSLGYDIPPQVLYYLLQKYDRTSLAKAMDYDSFVECGLIVKGLTDEFKEKDTQRRGWATLDYTTFMLMVLRYIVP